jgi:2-polyprenyl-6-methoxyphenol hydroxylase-like FAD-dependent oxidoreductase
LEKHADFLRDFRGDTVHPSTPTLIDELGLWPRFSTLPFVPLRQVRVLLDGGPVHDLLHPLERSQVSHHDLSVDAEAPSELAGEVRQPQLPQCHQERLQ